MPGKDRFDRKNRRAGARSAGLDAAGLFLSAQGAKDAARAARIAELKAQIKAGTYRPDLEKVAERLLPDLLSE
jgi:anti-sigma28 factor (negative regulator of flagellin synthesis)